MKIKYYDRKLRESVEIHMAEVRYKQDKVLNRSNGNFLKTNVTNENIPLEFEIALL